MTPTERAAFVARLDPFERTVVADVLERDMADREQAGWRADPASMALHLEAGQPEAFHPYRFAVFLAQKFRDAVTGADPFQIWNLPSQLGKTTVVRRCLAWALDRDPSLPIIVTSYGQNLATNTARWVRDYGEQHADQLRFRLRADATRSDEWLTTAGGGIKAAGIRGGLAGFPAGGIVFDDPFKSWKDAHSPATQEEVWELYRSVLRVRLRMGGWIVIIHNRWCENDLTDRVMTDARETGERWTQIRLPMLAEPADPEQGIGPDPLGRAPGEPLEPERYDRDAALARAKAIGPYLAAAQEQQRPAPIEGGMIKRIWWQVERDVPERFDMLITSWDMKLKDVAKQGDYVAGQVWGRVGSQFWCLDQLHGQFDFLTTKVAVALLALRYPDVVAHWLENTGNGPEVMRDLRAGHDEIVAPDGVRHPWTIPPEIIGTLGVLAGEVEPLTRMLRQGIPGLLPNDPKGDKTVRVLATTGYLQAGDVHLRDAPFAYSLIEEAAQFPRSGVPDDQVDAYAQAILKLSGGMGAGPDAITTAAGQSIARPSAAVSSTAGRRINR